jgi:hypothetical protein
MTEGSLDIDYYFGGQWGVGCKRMMPNLIVTTVACDERTVWAGCDVPDELSAWRNEDREIQRYVQQNVVYLEGVITEVWVEHFLGLFRNI